ncbi:hypothetical protein [Thalassomonas sp. M1454]|uniref:hypothetical protein n=1 Tax=Thalassomonas sp. M1454 TaxID=2594477 RepID=UPI00117DA311|nr:hypothetical protein [Thalassomonas sp. M1454]TRX55656.1 hypothetical protein FNN08_08460 [Thalassomonas sp. M1454]
MKKLFLLLMIMLPLSFTAYSAEDLSEESINHIAQQFVAFHQTEAAELLTAVLAPDLEVVITQGSSGYGFILNYNKTEYIEYLQQAHKSKSRTGTDVSFISSEFLGDKEAKVIVRYRSKKLKKYVWVEAIISLVNNEALVTQIEEYT